MEAAILWRSNYGKVKPELSLIWLLHKTLKQNKTITGTGQSIPCHKLQTSSLLSRAEFNVKTERLIDLCTRLNMFKFSSNSKSWNDQLHLQIFPNPPLLVLTSLEIFNYEVGAKSKFLEFMQPSKITKKHLIFLMKTSASDYKRDFTKNVKLQTSLMIDEDDEEIKPLYSWIVNAVLEYTKSNVKFPKLSHRLFLVAYVKASLNRSKGFENIGSVNSVVKLEYCGSCRANFYSNPALIKLTTNLSRLSLDKPSPESNTLWYIPHIYISAKRDRIFDGIINHLEYCPNLLTKEHRSFGHLPFKNWNDILYHGLAHLLIEAMHNYTYRSFNAYICSNGKITK